MVNFTIRRRERFRRGGKSIVALDGEVGQIEEGAASRDIGEAREGGLCFFDEAPGYVVSAVESVGVVDLADGPVNQRIASVVALDYPADFFPRLGVGGLQVEHGWEGDSALAKVAADRLAQLLGGGVDIEDVIHYLEGHAKLSGVMPQALYFVLRGFREDRADLACGSEEDGGLGVDTLVVLLDRGGHVVGGELLLD